MNHRILVLLTISVLFALPAPAQVVSAEANQENHDAATLLLYELSKHHHELKSMQRHVDEIVAGIDKEDDGIRREDIERSEVAGISMGLDANADGILTQSEIKDAIARSFEEVDPDRNGKISSGELHLLYRKLDGAIGRIKRVAELARQGEICGLDPIPDGGDLAVVGAKEGLGLASVSLAGKSRLTHYSEILIEKTDRPLHLVFLAKEPMIVRIEDPTKSLGSVIGIGQNLGFVGVTETILRYPKDPHGCDLFAWHFGREADVLKTIETAVGQEARYLAGGLFQGRLSLPSRERHGIDVAENSIGPTDPSAYLDFRMQGEYPLGYIDLDPSDVITPAKKETYEIPPYIPGLIQLLKDGAISPLERGDEVRVAPRRRTGGSKIGSKIIVGGDTDMRNGWVFPVDGFIYSYHSDGDWHGERSVGFAVHRQITLPIEINYRFYFVPDEGVPAPHDDAK